MQRNWIGRSTGAHIDFPVPRTSGDQGLHHPAGHRVRRHLHGAGARARAGRRDRRPTPWPDGDDAGRWTGGHATPGRGGRGLPGVRGRRERDRADRRGQGEDRRLHRRRTPPTRSTARRSRSSSPTTCWPATAPARSWRCPARTSGTGSSPRSSTCRSSGPCSRPRASTARRTWATARRSTRGFLDGLGVAEAKAAIIEWLEAHERRPGRGHLPAARLAVQPAAVLGRAVPDRLRRDRAADRAARVDAAGGAARGGRLLAEDVRPGRRRQHAGDAAVAGDRLGRGRAGPGRRPEAVHPRDQHDAAVGRLVLVRAALPGPGQRRPSWSTRTTSSTGWARGPQGDAGGVDLYVGGVEHAVLHLLYARFWHKVLYDLGHVTSFEPFRRLFNQGMIQAYAYTDARGVYVPAEEVVERDGHYFLGERAGQPRVRQDGQVAEERRHAGRHVRGATARTRSGCTRCRWARWTCPGRGRPGPWSARTGSCSGSGGWSWTRRPAAAGWSTPKLDEETNRLLHRTIDGVRTDMDEPAVQHRDRQADRADQPGHRDRRPARRGRWPSRWC